MQPIFEAKPLFELPHKFAAKITIFLSNNQVLISPPDALFDNFETFL